MKLIDGLLYLTWAESLVNEKTLYQARSRSSEGYVFATCPAQGKLVQYDALSAEQKLALIQSGLYGADLYAYYYSTGFEVHLQRDDAARSYYRQVKVNGVGLVLETIDKYTRYAEVMNLLKTAKGMLAEAMQYLNTRRICGINNIKRFKEKLRLYIAEGYGVLISGKHGNSCARKIDDTVGNWLLAMYALPIKMTVYQLHLAYTAERELRGWAELSESGIEQYLKSTDVIQRWYLGRHGKHEFEQRFGIQNKIIRASCAHRLWLSDGTGFNYESDVNMHRIYWVIDDHSECIIGWSWSKSENHKVAYQAYKDAVKKTGYRPQEIRYDNASSHTPLKPFFSKLASLRHAPSAPNRASGKTIESVTGRFQQQIMRNWWFFTGQNRGSRKQDSKQNDYFVDKHKKDLPAFEDILHVFAADVEQWNNAPHHATGRPRISMLLEDTNDKAQQVDMFDMIELFGTECQRTYTARGIMIQIGKDKYEYEVRCDGQPDLAFRQRYIKEQFTVKYDPDDLSFVALYQQAPEGLKFVTTAEPMAETHYAAGDHTEGEINAIKARDAVRRAYTAQAERELKQLEQATGISGDLLVEKQNKQVRTLAQKWREDDDHNPRQYATSPYASDDEEDYSNLKASI